MGTAETVGDPDAHTVPLVVKEGESVGDWEGERLVDEEPVRVGTCVVATGEALLVTQTVAEPVADVEPQADTVADTVAQPLGVGD